MPFYTMPDGEQLHVRRFGQGQPVLVLSGLGMQSWQWLPFLYPHRKQFEFIIPDWRGFGPSVDCAIPKNLNAIESHWNDIACLIEQLKLDQFIVIAYSMGATTSMYGFEHAKFDQKLKAYLHIDQTPHIAVTSDWPYGLMGTHYPQLLEIFQRIIEVLDTHPQAKYLDELPKATQTQLIQAWFKFLQLQQKQPWLKRITAQISKIPKINSLALPMQRVDYVRWYISNYAQHRDDYRAAMANLSCPATYFIGRQSSLYHSDGQLEIAKRTPHAKSIVFEHSGHAPLLKEPLKFSHELGQFLKRSAASSGI